MGDKEYQVGWERGCEWRKWPQGEVYSTSQRPLALDNNLSLHLGQRQRTRMRKEAQAWELGAFVT